MSPESLNAVFVPFLFAVGSVALGALLALLPGVGARSLGPIQTFSVAAALTVVLVHLIPESADSLGMWALVGFAAGLVAPLFIEGLLDRIARLRASSSPLDHDVITAEVGFAGLLIHQVGDGVGLWVTSGSGETSLNAAFALSAHTVPLATLFVLRFATLKGRRSALVHAAGLAAASAIGILIGSIVPGEIISQFNPWIEAVVAGLLLHVITHDLHIEKDRTTVIKILDMAALVIGVGVTLLASQQHGIAGHEAGHAEIGREAFLHAIFDLAVESAPVLLTGLAAAALVQVTCARLRAASLHFGARAQALRGAALGSIAPIQASHPLRLARRLHIDGYGGGLVIAFLFAAPSLGIESLALTWKFLGTELSLLRLLGSALLALLVGLVASRLSLPPRPTGVADAWSDDKGRIGFRAYALSFDELLLHVAPWMVVGLIAAAYVQTLMPAEQVVALTRAGLDVPLMIIVAIPTYIGAATATPLAAVLLAKGVSPGAVVAGLVIGPALNLAVISFLRRTIGARVSWVILVAAIGVAMGMAYAINAVHQVTPRIESPLVHEHGMVATLAAVAVLAFTARSLWQTGLRAWVSSLLGISASDGEQGHGHSHHGHVH